MNGTAPTSTLDPQLASVSTPQFSRDFDGNEADLLRQQIGQGDFKGLRHYLARTRQNRDWQDRYFILDIVAPAILPASLDALCRAEQNAADLFLIRAAHLFDLISRSQGNQDGRSHPRPAIHSGRAIYQGGNRKPPPRYPTGFGRSHATCVCHALFPGFLGSSQTPSTNIRTSDRSRSGFCPGSPQYGERAV